MDKFQTGDGRSCINKNKFQNAQNINENKATNKQFNKATNKEKMHTYWIGQVKNSTQLRDLHHM